MKNLCAATLAICVVMSGSCRAQQALPASGDQSNLSNSAASHSPAEQLIQSAKGQLLANPKKLQAFNDLASAYIKRARETADPRYYANADDALARGLAVDPSDFQLLKTQVALMLCRHQFAQAKEKATVLNHRWRDDVATYGYLAEAEIALGEYADAETNTQWMLNMLPNNVPGLILGAKLRVLFGEPDGALDFLNLAYAETSPTEVEELAWIANQMAAVEINAGKVDAADGSLDRADQTFPHYAYTLENRARVRLAQHRPIDAVALLMQARQIDSDPHVTYELAKAEAAAGQTADAHAALVEFEKVASETANQVNDSALDLILMYAESTATKARALELARHQVELRSDVWTLDANAWALYASGKYTDADASMQRAIAVGIRSAQLFDHAGHIALALHRDEDAAKDFALAMQSNPASEYAADARANLALPPAAKQITSVPSQGAQSELPQTMGTADLIASAPTSGAANEHAASVPAEANPTWAGFQPIPVELLTPRPTSTEHAIHAAQAMVAHNEKDGQSYAALGAAYFQRARETGDVSDYELADQALTRSLDLDSADFPAASAYATMAEVCMGEHRFNDALTYAQKALSLGSGDVSPFAIIGDAYADMGEYDKARAAYARLTPPEMTLSPRAAYARDSRLSYLLFIAGNTTEAIRLMKIAVAEGTEAEIPSENLAWLYFELAEYSTQAGDTSTADTAYVTALKIHPGDYRALAGLAKLRANHERYSEAVELYKRAIAVVPMPIFIAELGDLYSKSGNMQEAKKQYQLVEYIAQLGRINQVLHNRDLALYYSDHDMNLVESLTLAQKELEVRHDVYTWDALAWALFKNGKFSEAATASQSALKYGTQDALVLYHAGMISARIGHKDEAAAELKKALQINPNFHLLYAPLAQQELARLDASPKDSAVNHGR